MILIEMAEDLDDVMRKWAAKGFSREKMAELLEEGAKKMRADKPEQPQKPGSSSASIGEEVKKKF